MYDIHNPQFKAEHLFVKRIVMSNFRTIEEYEELLDQQNFLVNNNQINVDQFLFMKRCILSLKDTLNITVKRRKINVKGAKASVSIEDNNSNNPKNERFKKQSTYLLFDRLDPEYLLYYINENCEDFMEDLAESIVLLFNRDYKSTPLKKEHYQNIIDKLSYIMDNITFKDNYFWDILLKHINKNHHTHRDINKPCLFDHLFDLIEEHYGVEDLIEVAEELQESKDFFDQENYTPIKEMASKWKHHKFLSLCED